ncbi:ankyrin repeat domain-containing protein [Thiosocius teredinicola]|uniref:ankyrin repeat domain-containing protein n=1 Tax=Thiosocius teredinicola TaxID=1973002 RepID=UPI000990A7BE
MSSGSYELAAEAYALIMHDDLAALERLLSNIEDVNALSERGRSLLAWACYFNRQSVIDWLLQHGADPNHRDDEDWTPLKHAIHHDDAGLIKKLVAHGADPHVRCRAGHNLLWSAWVNEREIAFRTLARLGLRPRRSGVPRADYKYLLNGGTMKGRMRPLTSPPIPLYAPIGVRDYAGVAHAFAAHLLLNRLFKIAPLPNAIARLLAKPAR